jgi:hypothetical protein
LQQTAGLFSSLHPGRLTLHFGLTLRGQTLLETLNTLAKLGRQEVFSASNVSKCLGASSGTDTK